LPFNVLVSINLKFVFYVGKDSFNITEIVFGAVAKSGFPKKTGQAFWFCEALPRV